VNFLTMVGKLVASTVCLRINKTGRGPIQLSYCPATMQRQTTFVA